MQDKPESALLPSERKGFFEELYRANAVSSRFGLVLNESAMMELAEQRARALVDHGRVELGECAVHKIIEGFCDSPFLLQEDYEATLLELTDAFYYFKNACGEQLSDDELIAAMRKRYDTYDGSTEAVIGTTLETLCRARRIGQDYEDDWEDEDADD